MFLRAKKRTKGRELVLAPQAPTPRQMPMPPSIVAGNLYIKGDLVTDGDVHVDGRVDGEIRARIVTIGEAGRVEGAVICDELIVFGVLSGRAEAARVFLMGSCRVVADIVHDLLRIEDGASFEGSCRRKLAAAAERPIEAVRFDPFAA
jgi:cytoskeletal protein CcmA (bactofilin family)